MRCRRRDHPRLCGNNDSFTGLAPLNKGSPPPVREQPSVANKSLKYRGITPACAGTTFRVHNWCPRGEDHPRLCGNNSPLISVTSSSTGSPPPVREQPMQPFVWLKNQGITPACAGTTTTATESRRLPRDHPRLCGNNTGRHAAHEVAVGSPPPVREQLRHLHPHLGDRGITPACAGTTPVVMPLMKSP